MKKISCFIIFLLLAALISLPFWPWKNLVHDAIQSQLAKKNITAEFTVETVVPGTLILKNIVIKESPVALDSLEVRYNARELMSKRLDLQSAVLRSKDGEFSLRPVKADLFRPGTVDMMIDVKNMPLDFIMNLITAGRASATGNVSGTLPLTLKDGVLTLHSSKLTAGGTGVITVAADAIPGDNEQIDVVREALKNFHYQKFVLAIETGEAKKLSILLQLRGNNPDAYNGREIKLNVRLEGDLLEVWQQSVITVTDPKQFLEQK